MYIIRIKMIQPFVVELCIVHKRSELSVKTDFPSEMLTNCYLAHQKESYHMSRVVRKPTFCICENKDADQLRGNREADQRPCFRYIDSTIPLVSKSEISSL